MIAVVSLFRSENHKKFTLEVFQFVLTKICRKSIISRYKRCEAKKKQVFLKTGQFLQSFAKAVYCQCPKIGH